MLRSALAGALTALLLFSAPLSAQTTRDDPGSLPAPDLLTGRAYGSWNLPADGNPGVVRGRLVGVEGLELGVTAKLTPARLPDGQRGGIMEGLLVAQKSDLTLRPVAKVRGYYLVGPDGRGAFEASILRLVEDPAVGPVRIGRLAGSFADPRTDRADTVGTFVGRWAIRR